MTGRQAETPGSDATPPSVHETDNHEDNHLGKENIDHEKVNASDVGNSITDEDATTVSSSEASDSKNGGKSAVSIQKSKTTKGKGKGKGKKTETVQEQSIGIADRFWTWFDPNKEDAAGRPEEDPKLQKPTFDVPKTVSQFWGVKPVTGDPRPNETQPPAKTSDGGVVPPLWEDRHFRYKAEGRFVQFFTHYEPSNASTLTEDKDQHAHLGLKLMKQPERKPMVYWYINGYPKNWNDDKAIKALNDRRRDKILATTQDPAWQKFEREYLAKLLRENRDASIWDLTVSFNDRCQAWTPKAGLAEAALLLRRTVESVRYEYISYKNEYDEGTAPNFTPLLDKSDRKYLIPYMAEIFGFAPASEDADNAEDSAGQKRQRETHDVLNEGPGPKKRKTASYQKKELTKLESEILKLPRKLTQLDNLERFRTSAETRKRNRVHDNAQSIQALIMSQLGEVDDNLTVEHSDKISSAQLDMAAMQLRRWTNLKLKYRLRRGKAQTRYQYCRDSAHVPLLLGRRPKTAIKEHWTSDEGEFWNDDDSSSDENQMETNIDIDAQYEKLQYQHPDMEFTPEDDEELFQLAVGSDSVEAGEPSSRYVRSRGPSMEADDVPEPQPHVSDEQSPEVSEGYSGKGKEPVGSGRATTSGKMLPTTSGKMLPTTSGKSLPGTARKTIPGKQARKSPVTVTSDSSPYTAEVEDTEPTSVSPEVPDGDIEMEDQEPAARDIEIDEDYDEDEDSELSEEE